jgi:hypothetical protein
LLAFVFVPVAKLNETRDERRALATRRARLFAQVGLDISDTNELA